MATIRDIAKLARVSVATVSRSLKMPDLVAPATRDRVQAAVDRLGYKPNALARGFRRQRSEAIVVVVPYIHNPFYASVVQGIGNVAHANGYRVLLGESQDSQPRLDTYALMLDSKEADGLILLGALLPSVIGRDQARSGRTRLPLVMACEYFPGLDAPTVRIDNVKAAAAAADHLIQLGHRRIANITGPQRNPLSRDRLKGFQAQMARAKLAVPRKYIVHGDFTAHSGYVAMKRLLDLPSRPTAVTCANDEMAMGALKAIKERRLSVPNDISVIGFDNIRFSEFCDPPLTTIAQPQVEIGETAMRLMLEVIAGRATATTVVLPYTLVLRASTHKAR
jgi:LacI family repressor for deo operon, udp, cdd, tsx, nupC, and nupG